MSVTFQPYRPNYLPGVIDSWENYTHVLHQYYYKSDCSDTPQHGMVYSRSYYIDVEGGIPIPPETDCYSLSYGGGNSGTTYYRAWFANTTAAAVAAIANPFQLANSSRTHASIGFPILKVVGGQMSDIANTQCQDAAVDPYWYQFWILNPQNCYYYFSDSAGHYFDNSSPNCNNVAAVSFSVNGTTVVGNYRNYNSTDKTCSATYKNDEGVEYPPASFAAGCTTGLTDCFDAAPEAYYRFAMVEQVPITTTTAAGNNNNVNSANLHSSNLKMVFLALALSFLF